jgi:hypothetical protein
MATENAGAIDPAVLTILQGTPELLRHLLAALPPAILHRPNPEGWSVKDVVAHMHDVESIAFTVRIRRMVEEHNPAIASIDPSARLEDGGYAARALDELLAELAVRRAENLTWLQSLDPAALARTGLHDTAGTITPAAIVHQWAFHDLAHTRQIMEMLQAPLTPGMGNTRTFYPEAQALYTGLLASHQ